MMKARAITFLINYSMALVLQQTSCQYDISDVLINSPRFYYDTFVNFSVFILFSLLLSFQLWLPRAL